jgi:hypothetical protein
MFAERSNVMVADGPVPPLSEIHLLATDEPRRGLFRFFPPATRSELWGGSIFLILSLLGAAWVLKCRAEALDLEHDSVIVDGKVLRLWKTKPKNRTYFRVEYEYPASLKAGTPMFRDTAEVDEQQFNGLKEGGPIAVKVCRTDPSNHQVVGESPRVFLNKAAMVFCLGLIALLALAGVIMLWWWWISRRKAGCARLFVGYGVFVLDVKSASKRTCA